MFAGIVETKSTVLHLKQGTGVLRATLKRPSNFSDIKTGDSIATNGVCLTVEAFDDTSMQFAIGAETLKVTGWSEQSLKAAEVNLERSLQFGDRLHGHMVTGHVDTLATVKEKIVSGECVIYWFEVPKKYQAYIWAKGSIAINGVSLTINEVNQSQLSVCLIPETLSVTNLVNLKPNDQVNIEVDNMARAFVNFMQLKEQNEHNS